MQNPCHLLKTAPLKTQATIWHCTVLSTDRPPKNLPASSTTLSPLHRHPGDSFQLPIVIAPAKHQIGHPCQEALQPPAGVLVPVDGCLVLPAGGYPGNPSEGAWQRAQARAEKPMTGQESWRNRAMPELHKRAHSDQLTQSAMYAINECRAPVCQCSATGPGLTCA